MNTPIVIASGNGLQAARHAYGEMISGADPLDAAVSGVNLVELDPNDHTVGYGGLPNRDGVIQLDAAVMHGPLAKAGAVGALEGVKLASSVARLVMLKTDHVMLAGDGARRFAQEQGFVEENLLSEFSRKVWMHWREIRKKKSSRPSLENLDPDVRKFVEEHPTWFVHTGTVHLSVRNASGDLACCTSTSGLPFRLSGRIADSALVGAGLYCDNHVGSAGCTGRGEAAILSNASAAAVEIMRRGVSPLDSAMKVLERVVDLNRDPRWRDISGRPTFNLAVYALNKAGECASAAVWNGGTFAVADQNGARLENQAFLYRRE